MSSTTLEKHSKNMKESKKPPLSYSEALDIIHACDTVIKQAAVNRMSPPDSTARRVYARNLVKSFSYSTTLITSAFTADMLNIMDSVIAAPIGLFGSLAMAFTGVIMANNEKGSKILSPLKYRSREKEVLNEVALFDLKEQEFAAIEAKVFKKAKKAMKVINKNVSFDNREITYSNVLGKEGFDIVQTKKLSALESEKLRLQKMEMDSLKALQQPPSLAALGAGTTVEAGSRS